MKRRKINGVLGAVAIAIASVPTIAMAQSAGADLLALNGSQLRSELQSRYDGALAATRDPAVVGANDTRYLWASEAKVQCGIAIGYMKSSTKDEPSVRKCGDAYARYNQTLLPPAPEVVANVPNAACANPIAGTVFFDFNADVAPIEAGQTVDAVASSFANCGWRGLAVAGHTDRSGSDAYNNALSMRRAQAVATLLQARGINPNALAVTAHGESEPRVPTPDGERNPQNRRVEITAN
ncbi:hypothetical protein NT2_02_05950 [Caenibius tardaugens NBRC 16725]|uniref:OmpA-like domain-containing protein n=1 Tax=Caenibius tardaugens NBRC 16725 TaxID=1219035 RepID=U2Y5V3_9SPHN|nr:OmpA family protein [Caenibius tardaugens]GAD48511.1 hypothetical protein NT2_02_05950 [Caenibius tardaugens NBRC 16725]